MAGLKAGDYITVWWIDASETRYVRYRRLPLPNSAVETRKRTFGRFLTVQKGYTWKVPHLVLLLEETDELYGQVISIPLPLVMKVEAVQAKTPLKHQRTVLVRRFPDGRVKYLG